MSRQKNGKAWMFVLNYQASWQTVNLRQRMRSLFSGECRECEQHCPHSLLIRQSLKGNSIFAIGKDDNQLSES